MFTGNASTVSLLRTSATKARMGMAALGLAVGLAGPLAQGVAAHDTVYGGTDAYCTTVNVSALYGTSYRYINGAFPTGVTTGATYLAARLQTRLVFNGPVTGNYTWITWSNGSKWVRTTVARFPYGQFVLNSTWYRRATIPFNENWLNQSIQARIVWLIAWPDGHRSTATTKWATCY